ncbi:cyclic nucleotide-binding/CBS domain-containing protein [Rhodopila sp.]|uniref:CBS domain-containing protein n=1 Tax=Rhodopila sp. TaxID=2480087 RepID=UPI002C0E88F9|nr:CBS domain-containing protein [Rhodopila sp.]HVZ08150.1 CBS domain-containing protein [Rhodopila sp.]
MSEIIRRQRPVTLPISATVQQACQLMRERKIGAILVTGGGDQLVGIFTGRDAVGRVLAEALDPATTLLGVVMTGQPDTLGPFVKANEAQRMMRDGGYRHLPVVEGNKIIGIVSQGDFNGLERARHDEETGYWEIL